jgi:uncharacterized integral membrane protein
VKKLGFILMAVAAIVIGLLVGTLNADSVQLDLLWMQFEMPLGLALLIGFSVGVVLGLAAIYVVRVLPLRHQLRKARVALAKQDDSDLSLPND